MADTSNDPLVLFRDDRSGHEIVFSRPSELIRISRPENVESGFARLEHARRSGKWAAGYIGYEAGFSLDPALSATQTKRDRTPLLCFGVFDAPGSFPPPGAAISAHGGERPATALFGDIRAGWSRETYQERFAVLHGHIARGDCYQANLTFPFRARCTVPPEQLFRRLIVRQPVRYGALVRLGFPRIVSRSPELFFDLGPGRWLETHPMKGTVRRGVTAEEDHALKEGLRRSDKNRAENRMIVDLLRNDLSRISETGTVTVPKLFEVETYPTLHQMISKVRGRLRDGLTVRDIFAALFPCGSITGAPKIGAMKILRALEDRPRGAYCGAIGYIGPGGQMRFSVAIRTISIHEDGEAVFNVGGGIVFDSYADSEYDEALLKAGFAMGPDGIDAD